MPTKRKRMFIGRTMNNSALLFTENTEYRPRYRIVDGKAVFVFKESTFNGDTVRKILGMIKGFRNKHRNSKMPLCLYFAASKIKIEDKLSYVLLECVCYHMIHELRHPVEIYWNPEDTIWTQGIFSSPMLLLNGKYTNSVKIQNFEKHFNWDSYRSHYRRMVSINEKLHTNYLGNLYQDIDSFLKLFKVKEEHRDNIASMCSELVGNAGEHAHADCLIDIDVTSDHEKWAENGLEEGAYYAINIAIVNFSPYLIGEGLKKIITAENLKLGERYEAVRAAYQVHRQKFTADYDEDDFYNISVFQDRISGRQSSARTGGTGLTLLIKNMQDNADSANCYMISGDRCISFEKDLLEYDKDGWIGFNTEKNYFSDIPDENMIARCYINMPGTAYNLNFILRREVDDE